MLFDANVLQNLEMPFGKHKGTKIVDLDGAYLLWMVEKIESGEKFNPPWVNQAVVNEWKRRGEVAVKAKERAGLSQQAVTDVLIKKDECGCKVWLRLDPDSRADVTPREISYLVVSANLEYCEAHA